MKNFKDAFKYVHEKPSSNKLQWCDLTKNHWREREALLFTQELLFLLRYRDRINILTVLEKKEDISRFQYLGKPSDALNPVQVNNRKMLLKFMVSILRICSITGVEQSIINNCTVPTDEDMRRLIPQTEFRQDRIPTLPETLDYFTEQFINLIIVVNYTTEIDQKKTRELSLCLYMSLLYWFDTDWLPNFLSYIPTVINGK